jgi:hypothetical protein
MKNIIRKICLFFFVCSAISPLALAHQSVPSVDTGGAQEPTPKTAKNSRLPVNFLGSSTSNWCKPILSVPEAVFSSLSTVTESISDTITAGSKSSSAGGSTNSSGDSSPMGPIGGGLTPNAADKTPNEINGNINNNEDKGLNSAPVNIVHKTNSLSEARKRFKNPHRN